MPDTMLDVRDLHVTVDGKEILKGMHLVVKKGQIHALMGPNGSGKSTLAYVLMGHPKYVVTRGTILFNGEDITVLPAHERARRGLFLAFQYPVEVSGVSVANFLRTAYNTLHSQKKLSVLEFRKFFEKQLERLRMDKQYATRSLNEGFSGGEKKRTEIVQLLTLDPVFAVLDEPDSGLDIDALKVVSAGIRTFANKEKGVLVITHYRRLLDLLQPDTVSIMIEGTIALEGDSTIIDQLEEKGYGWIEVSQ